MNTLEDRVLKLLRADGPCEVHNLLRWLEYGTSGTTVRLALTDLVKQRLAVRIPMEGGSTKWDLTISGRLRFDWLMQQEKLAEAATP